MMRPGWMPSTWTWLDRETASSIEWVTSTMVLPVRCQISSSDWLICVAGDGVERAERLVHQQDRGIERQGAGDRDALAHAAGELARPLVAGVAEADQVQHRLGALPQRRARHGLVGDAAQQGGVVERVLPGQQVGVLEHEADHAPARRLAPAAARRR